MTGSGLFRFPNLADVRAGMHAAGYQFLEDLPAAQRVARPDCEPGQEQLSLTRAALNSAVRDRESVFRSAGNPPKVFISYRWESPEIKQWVARAARYVQNRGFTVFLDQDVAALRGNDPIQLGRYLAVIVDCQIVLCVVTPQYLAGLGPRAWLGEERQLMNLLAGRGAVVVHLLRDGEVPPGPVRDAFSAPFDPTRGVTIEALVPDRHAFRVDMRGNRVDDFNLLDPHLTYNGPRLSAKTEPSFRPWLERMARAHDAGAVAMSRADLDEGADFVATSEFRRIAAHFAARAGDQAGALRLACAACDNTASAETLIDMGVLLRELGSPQDALDALARLPWWLAEDWSWRVHFVQGDVLDDVGSHVAALAHLTHALTLARRSGIEQRPSTADIARLRATTGYVLLFRLGDPAGALDHLRAACQDDPGAANAVNLIVCLAALGDWAAAQDVWAAASGRTAAADRAAFADLRTDLIARHLRLPLPSAHRSSADASWECPACSVQLEMGPSDVLCASCGTAYSDATRCPCCRRDLLAGAGARRSADLIPPKCPICNAGVPMHHPTDVRPKTPRTADPAGNEKRNDDHDDEP